MTVFPSLPVHMQRLFTKAIDDDTEKDYDCRLNCTLAGLVLARILVQFLLCCNNFLSHIFFGPAGEPAKPGFRLIDVEAGFQKICAYDKNADKQA